MQNDLLKQAQLGIEAEAFLSTDLGRYLLDKADQELEDAQNKFLELLPNDSAGLLQLQSQAKRAINFKSWLSEAISTGIYAEQELKDE
jgi:hypothetical protein